MMIKEVFPDLFRIKVPLPHNSLGHLNAYLVKSDEQTLLIDTGLDFPQAFEAIHKGLSKAGVNKHKLTDILLTHFHIDHIGLIPRIKNSSKSLNLWIHSVEKELSRSIVEDFRKYLSDMKDFLKASDAPSSYADNLQNFHPAFFTPRAYEEIAKDAYPLCDGQEIHAGQYSFQVLWTPGHSPGHICLYEPNLKVLIAGDHVLPTITPHVSQFMVDTNPLEDYLKSLEKVEGLNVKVVLPAHEKPFTDLGGRVRQLKNHHEKRLKEILTLLLKNGSLTPYRLASMVSWNVKYKSWDTFPPFQKYLALGETLSHLTFLEKKGLVKKNVFNQKTLYELTNCRPKLFP
jgi:glyoxylase-like metal-dependent hydrolase (beta-lactamase superfamily II)